MYFAVQAMAAEFTTGALVMFHIKSSGKNISMLVAQNKAVFTKRLLVKSLLHAIKERKLQNALKKQYKQMKDKLYG